MLFSRKYWLSDELILFYLRTTQVTFFASGIVSLIAIFFPETLEKRIWALLFLPICIEIVYWSTKKRQALSPEK